MRRQGELRQGIFEETTEEERAAREAEAKQLSRASDRARTQAGIPTPPDPTEMVRQIDAKLREKGPVDENGNPVGGNGAVARDRMPELAPGAIETNRPPGTPGVYGPVGGPRQPTGGEAEVTAKPTPYPVVRGKNTVPKPTAQSQPAQGGQPGTTGPGSGNGNVPAPPTAAGAVRTEDPRTRTAAFDPGRERINTDQTTAARQMDQQGNVVYPSQQELASMVATAAQGRVGANGEPATIGDGAINRDNLYSLVGQHNQGGQLTNGQAMLAGMHAKFKMLLSQGRAKEAATMAWGIIQAANLEAASLGMVARDQIRNGDTQAGLKTLAQAADWSPDGKKHVATQNGIATYDANGNLTANTVIDGRRALGLALGFADGSAMHNLIWDALKGSASLLNPPDKNAEGRGLVNELRRLQVEAARRKLAGGGGKGGGESAQATALKHYLATGNLPSTPSTSGGSSSEPDVLTAEPAGGDLYTGTDQNG